ncbi:MAG: hypothetical protein IJ996_02860 [Clostridia bacterium]|nr:hypothetical protein [Clostridia bacterium]
MIKSKIETYLGFCLRAGKLLFGIDNVEKTKRNAYLLIADETLSENSFKTLVKARETLSCPLLVGKAGFLSECLHRAGVKVIAVRDESLAKAILQNVQESEQVKLYSGGNN